MNLITAPGISNLSFCRILAKLSPVLWILPWLSEKEKYLLAALVDPISHVGGGGMDFHSTTQTTTVESLYWVWCFGLLRFCAQAWTHHCIKLRSVLAV